MLFCFSLILDASRKRFKENSGVYLVSLTKDNGEMKKKVYNEKEKKK
jgi:hypothetical protein